MHIDQTQFWTRAICLRSIAGSWCSLAGPSFAKLAVPVQTFTTSETSGASRPLIAARICILGGRGDAVHYPQFALPEWLEQPFHSFTQLSVPGTLRRSTLEVLP